MLKDSEKLRFWPLLTRYLDPEIFFQKSGSVSLLVLSNPNTVQKIRKIQWAVLSNLKDGLTDYFLDRELNPEVENCNVLTDLLNLRTSWTSWTEGNEQNHENKKIEKIIQIIDEKYPKKHYKHTDPTRIV